MRSILITGASGFAGQTLLRRMGAAAAPSTIYCLRRTRLSASADTASADVQQVTGDLCKPASYEACLRQVDTVVHLAAVTGKAEREEYFRVNAEGTRALVERCRAAGVQRFLHVSTIAVKFPDTRRYYYAQSKQQAEEAVRASGMRWTIVRPTILAGRGSPVLAGMAKLADLPVMPVFGDGRTPIQPVDVDDVAGFLAALIENDAFEGETIEFGGPDVIAMEEFMRKLARMRKGREPRVMRVPLGLMIPMLSLLERLLGTRLPVTVGQLSSFRFDGTAAPHPRTEQLWPQRKSVDEMLADARAFGASGSAAIPGCAPSDEATRASRQSDADLARECDAFARYLIGAGPAEYVARKYREAHAVSGRLAARGRFDALLVRVAARGPVRAAVADAYACLLARRSALRKKLILLAAILESSPSNCGWKDQADAGSVAGFALRLLGRGAGFAVRLAAALVTLGPLHVLMGTGDRARANRSEPA
ncbi:MAG: NAD-dependent epimerase/dehydratase family protein [Candidatus Acidiferrales bacterium]